MYELVTIARLYAKAAFDFAVEHHNVEHWQSMLTFSAEVSRNKQMSELLLGRVTPERIVQTFIAICSEKLDAYGQNLIRVMAENRRLVVMPYVLEQFILLRAEQEATMEVYVISANWLKEEQLTKINIAMERRLSRKIKLNCRIDDSIMAGVVIRAGDMVINNSVRDRLERLTDILQS